MRRLGFNRQGLFLYFRLRQQQLSIHFCIIELSKPAQCARQQVVAAGSRQKKILNAFGQKNGFADRSSSPAFAA